MLDYKFQSHPLKGTHQIGFGCQFRFGTAKFFCQIESQAPKRFQPPIFVSLIGFDIVFRFQTAQHTTLIGFIPEFRSHLSNSIPHIKISTLIQPHIPQHLKISKRKSPLHLFSGDSIPIYYINYLAKASFALVASSANAASSAIAISESIFLFTSIPATLRPFIRRL